MNAEEVKSIISKISRISLVYFLMLVVTFTGLGMVAFFFGMPYHVAAGTANNSFVINLPFSKVKKALMQKTAVEDIVSFNGGRLIEKNITGLNLSSEKLLSGWEADMTGKLIIQVYPPGMGTMVLHLSQKAHITKNDLESVTSLAEPSGHLQSVYSKLEMVGEEDHTCVNMSIQIVYARRVPFFLRKFMEKKLQEAATTVLKKNEAAILNLMEKPTKKFNIPLK